MLLKKKLFSIILVSSITFVYSFIFFITSGHIEFESILYGGELESKILALWSNFLMNGNQKYIAILYILLTVIIVLILVVKKQNDFDEYQYEILKKSLGIVGLLSLIAVPYMILMFLSVPNGLIEALLLLATIQWLIVLIYELFYIWLWC